MKPARIAYVVHGMVTGGIERCISHLCNNLDRHRFRAEIICLTLAAESAAWVERDDVRIAELRKRDGNGWRVVRQLSTVLRKHRIDIVHSHNWGTLVETCVARRLARTPVHIHSERGTVLDTVEFGGVKHRMRALAMRWALNSLDLVVSNAISVAKRIEERCGYPGHQVRLIPNGIMTPLVDSPEHARRRIRAAFGIPSDALLCGSVGRLEHVKGFDVAIRGLAEARRSGHDIRMVLVGEGSQRAELEALCEQLGVTRFVHFAGHQDAIGDYLVAMDLYVNSSRSEGMSQSIIEAMSLSLPLLVTDVGDNAELAGGFPSCGRIIQPDDVRAMASGLIHFAGSPNERADMGRNGGGRYATRYGLTRMIQAYEETYDRLLHPRRESVGDRKMH